MEVKDFNLNYIYRDLLYCRETENIIKLLIQKGIDTDTIIYEAMKKSYMDDVHVNVFFGHTEPCIPYNLQHKAEEQIENSLRQLKECGGNKRKLEKYFEEYIRATFTKNLIKLINKTRALI